MELKLETESVSIKLTTKDDKVDFKALVKVYELVTGDELEISETEPSRPEPKPSKPAIDRGANQEAKHSTILGGKLHGIVGGVDDEGHSWTAD